MTRDEFQILRGQYLDAMAAIDQHLSHVLASYFEVSDLRSVEFQQLVTRHLPFAQKLRILGRVVRSHERADLGEGLRLLAELNEFRNVIAHTWLGGDSQSGASVTFYAQFLPDARTCSSEELVFRLGEVQRGLWFVYETLDPVLRELNDLDRRQLHERSEPA